MEGRIRKDKADQINPPLLLGLNGARVDSHLCSILRPSNDSLTAI